MYKIENGQIIKQSPVGGLEEVVTRLIALSANISAITASYNRALADFERVPALQSELDSLITEAKKLPLPDDLSEECIVKLQEFEII